MSATGREVLRQAVNFPIQSGAADLMTYGIMPEVMLALIQQDCQSLVIMNRHDEIVIDVHPQEKEVVSEIIQAAFVNPPLPRGGVGLKYFTWDTYCASIKAPIPMKYEVKSFAAATAEEPMAMVDNEDEGDEDE